MFDPDRDTRPPAIWLDADAQEIDPATVLTVQDDRVFTWIVSHSDDGTPSACSLEGCTTERPWVVVPAQLGMDPEHDDRTCYECWYGFLFSGDASADLFNFLIAGELCSA